jgi:hypothetical protein
MFGMEDILTDQPSNPANNANAMMTTSNVFRNDSNITISFFPSPHLDEQLYRWRPHLDFHRIRCGRSAKNFQKFVNFFINPSNYSESCNSNHFMVSLLER